MVTIIAATNRPDSSTLKVAAYYQKKLAEKGANAGILSLTALPPAVISTDLYGQRSKEFAVIQKIVTETSKFLFIVPEYNGSFPGVLKVFIDACSFPESFYEKKTGLVGISSGRYGNIRGIEHFSGICNYIHLHVLPLRIHIPNIRSEINENGDLFLADTVKFTNEQMDKFIKF